METDGSVVHLLHQATQVADGVFTRTVRTLTPRQFAILKAVAASEGLSQTNVMVATGIDRSTVSSMTRTLVKRGYLARKRIKGDARTYAVRLTDAGRRVSAAPKSSIPPSNSHGGTISRCHESGCRHHRQS